MFIFLADWKIFGKAAMPYLKQKSTLNAIWKYFFQDERIIRNLMIPKKISLRRFPILKRL